MNNTDPEAQNHTTQADPAEQSAEQRLIRQLTDDLLEAMPGRYFRSRALHWMRQPEEDSAGAEAPAKWPDSTLAHEVKQRLGEGYQLRADADPSTTRTLDAFMLAHHAGECLLRHVLALQEAKRNRRVTWLAMASLQGGKQFKRQVQDLQDAEIATLTEIISRLFIPSELETLLKEEDETAWIDSAHEFCRLWLRHFARFHLDTANGYNAAKHGLSSVAGHSQISFFVDKDAWTGPWPGPGEVVMLEGAVLKTLEYQQVDQGRSWDRVTRAVDGPGLIACTLVAADLLDWLWAIEEARAHGRGVPIPLRWSPLPRDIVKGHEKAWASLRAPLAALPGAERIRKDELLQRLGITTPADAAQDTTDPEEIQPGTGGQPGPPAPGEAP